MSRHLRCFNSFLPRELHSFRSSSPGPPIPIPGLNADEFNLKEIAQQLVTEQAASGVVGVFATAG